MIQHLMTHRERVEKYISDDQMIDDLLTVVQSDDAADMLVRRLAQGWTATVEIPDDRNDGEYISLTKGEKSMTL